jgi:hypothetical protein
MQQVGPKTDPAARVQETTMTTATLRLSTPLPKVAAKAAPKGRSLLARFYDGIVEARMRQAVRELAMHRHLIPEDVLKATGYEATVTTDSALPFTR